MIRILNAMGARTLVFDQYARKSFPEHASDYGFTYVSLNRLLTQSDFISLHAPLTETTYHMFDKEVFKKVKPGLILVNCARGELVKTKDLVWALKKGIVAGAGLDVLERERERFFYDLQTRSKRLAKEDPDWNYLLQAENVIVSAHQAYFTSAALDQIAAITLQNASAAEKGELTQALVLKSDGTVING
ncbi:NAD(P)-dependent oxidoreductase [Mycoplasma sp. ATU-Cv-508]|uniref:NAD(P)-dependent oxidoreductase n=1 Tax=Mycoplasma sp. ATU-Cv-508 TaxID=2048001 RepID=UPI001F3A2368